jgi:hypothetical protein
MGHSSQCWCSKRRSVEPCAPNKDTEDAAILSLLEIDADSTNTQPREREFEPETKPSHSSDLGAMTTQMEAEVEIGVDSETCSQVSDPESEDWYGLNDTIHPTVTFEEDWALISPSTPYDELSSVSSSESVSEASERSVTAPSPFHSASVPMSLPPSPPLTPYFSSISTARTALSEVDDEDVPNSWMMNAICFPRDQDCVACLRCECICKSAGASASAVEWPSLQDSSEMIRRGRACRMW